MQWVAIACVVLSGTYAWFGVNNMSHAYFADEPPGPRRKGRLAASGFRAMGLFQLSVMLFMITWPVNMPPAWTSIMTLGTMGVIFQVVALGQYQGPLTRRWVHRVPILNAIVGLSNYTRMGQVWPTHHRAS